MAKQVKLYIERAKTAAEVFAGKVYVSDFIYEMDLAYAMADIVVSRAGAFVCFGTLFGWQTVYFSASSDCC